MQKYLILWLRNNLGLIALLMVSFLIYLPGLSGDFVVDDVPFIKDSPYIRDVGNITKFFTRGAWENSTEGDVTQSQYRPMTLLAAALNYQLWGSKPAGYHVYVLLLHLANICFVYALIRKLVAGSVMAAVIGAAMFALHPARVESVAWISGCIDPLVTFFLLGALLAHQSFTDSINKKWRYLALSLFCFQLALWSKEVAIVFPLIVVAHDLIYRRKINWPAALLHTMLVVGYLVARSLVLSNAGKIGAIAISQFSRVMDFALGYSELLVFPVKIPFYLQPPEHSVSSYLGIAGAMVLVMLAGFSWRTFAACGKKALAFSVVWMVGFFWPAVLLAFYGEGYYAARWLYTPMVGMAVFVAAFYEYMYATYPRLKIPMLASCALVAAFYGFITLKEIPAWHDNETIYRKIASLAPGRDGGFSGLGNYYLLQENYVEAEKNFMIALRNAKTPKDRVGVLVALGTIQGISSNFALSELYLQEAVRIDPKNSDAWAGLGNLSWSNGQFYEAISFYEKAIFIRPGNYEAAMNLAMAYEKVGQSERGALIRQQAATISRTVNLFSPRNQSN